MRKRNLFVFVLLLVLMNFLVAVNAETVKSDPSSSSPSSSKKDDVGNSKSSSSSSQVSSSKKSSSSSASSKSSVASSSSQVSKPSSSQPPKTESSESVSVQSSSSESQYQSSRSYSTGRGTVTSSENSSSSTSSKERSSLPLPEVTPEDVSSPRTVTSVTYESSGQSKILGIIACVFIGIGVLIILAIIFSSKKPKRNTFGRKRYKKSRKGKHLLADKYYRNIKRR